MLKIDTETIQVYPAKTRITLNDKATKTLFNQTEENYEKLMNGSKRGVIEKKKHKKHGDIKSGYQLQNENGYTNIAPLGEYERAVLDVCISEYDNGTRYISIAIIQRALSGKNCEGNKNGNTPYKNQLAEIKQSLDKLMCTLYDPDILEVYEELNYEGAEKITKSPILPAKRTEKIIGGKKQELIYFYDESPLAKQAKIKGQILTYPANLLDVPNQNNTPFVIALKNYTLRRVLEIKQHSKQLKPILTLEDIFKKCRITNADRKTKARAREYIDKFFAHLQKKKLIKSYEFTKKGNQFYSIKFIF